LEKYLEHLSTKSKKYRVANMLLKAIKDVVSKPFTGFRISVIDIEDVYKTLRECIRGCEDACEHLGKKVDRDALEGLLNEISKESGKSVDEIIDVVTYSLLLHEALTQLFKERSEYSKYRTIPMPRPFWKLVTSEDKLKLEPVSQILIIKQNDVSNWIPCSPCGFEPAVIRLRKRIRREVLDEEDFEEEDVKKLINMLKNYVGVDVCEGDPGDTCISGVKRVLMELGVKPGESLGPYCLLKRLVYAAATSPSDEVDELRAALGLPQRIVPSTDDIALKRYEESLITLVPSRKCDDLIGSICNELIDKKNIVGVKYDDRCSALRSVFCEDVPKDLELAARTLETKYELLIRKLSEAVERFIGARMNVQLFEKIIEARYGAKGVPEWLKNFIVKSYELRASRVIKRLAELYDGYLIVKGDADNAGLIASGHLSQIDEELNCERYSRYILSALELQKRIEYGAEALEKLRKVFTWICKVTEVLYGNDACKCEKSVSSVVVSPSYYQAFSSALMITAMKDLVITSRAGGLLIFSGGDDVLAILPPQSLWVVFELRSNYIGSKARPGFHCFNGMPLVPAIPFGRSFSARFAKIKDLMNEEIRETVELLEDRAKRAVWKLAGSELKKDTIVISRSRSEALVMLPLSKCTSQGFKCLADELGSYVLMLHLMLVSGILSANIPEDLDKFVSEALNVLSSRPCSICKVFEYVVSRNTQIREGASEILNSVFGRDPELRDLLTSTWLVSNSKTSPLLIELSKLIKVLRVIS